MHQESEQFENTGAINTAEGYRRLLDLLDRDERLAAVKYEQLRQRLIFFFDRRGCYDADLQADESLDRAARRAITEAIQDLTAFIFRVAHFRFLEVLRERERSPIKPGDLDEVLRTQATVGIDDPDLEDERAIIEVRERCLAECMEQLSKRDRLLLIKYYTKEGKTKLLFRQTLARQAGLTIQALRTRLCRLRRDLASCCRDCATSKRLRNSVTAL